MTDTTQPVATQDHIAQAVTHVGLFRVLITAIAAWWRQPRVPQDLPDHVRADLGLPSQPEIHYPSSAPDIRLHYR